MSSAQAYMAKSELLVHPWISQKFLRTYTQSKPVNYGLLSRGNESDRAWSSPIVRAAWPEALRDGLGYLYAHRETLYEMMESAPQIPCHLDFWPNNVFVVDTTVVPVDWAFFGSGTYGEDIGNFVPDAVFDGFVDGEDINKLERIMFDAYTQGLRAVNDIEWNVQSTFWASSVKYVWLGPLLLERATQGEFAAYGGDPISSEAAVEQYRSRGLALLRLCEWAESAIKEND